MSPAIPILASSIGIVRCLMPAPPGAAAPPPPPVEAVADPNALLRRWLDQFVPDVARSKALTWPTTTNTGETLSRIKAEWDKWADARMGLKDAAFESCTTKARPVEGPEHAQNWKSALGTLAIQLEHADRDLHDRLCDLGIPAAVADDVCRRARRQIWVARNVQSGMRSLCGRDRDIFESYGMSSPCTRHAVASATPELAAWLTSGDAAAEQQIGDEKLRHSPRIPLRDLVASSVQFDALLREGEAQLLRELQVPRGHAYQVAMRRVDQEQEMIADRFLNYVSEDRLTALRWRHEDRAAAYPAVAAAGKPDRLFAAVSAWAQTLPDNESATVMEHANRVFLQYAEARETAEKKILSVLLRSPLRGPPIPTRFVDPPDPDVDVWEQALNARLAAAATCVAGLLDLLPKEQRAAAEVKPPTEEESYLPLIPRP